ncbi:MAG: serine/threonine-protein kinase, partial [Planctomycetota bacterium]|nr:serine/threonine-protein kinase [Planctomycetota bacterium]
MTAPDAAELLDQLSEEFVARMRAGEAPSVATYAARHPELASEIEKLFPVLMRMEGFKEDVKQDLEAIDEALGTELGEYRLIREIGRGGMGVVYEAMQETLDRRVALKMLPSNLTKDPRFLERFRLEARAAGRLQHKNVVPVIGIGEHDGIHYFAMQYIEGRGLDELVADVRDRVQPHDADGTPDDDALVDRLLGAELREGSDPSVSTSGAAWSAPAARAVSELTRTWFDNAARLVLQASEGVAAAHARGILHRDIKPSNLMVDTTGKLWITDFGLCKEEGSNDLTRPGDMLGTLRYMPPERLAGESDVQGDIYGLGVTLYELLTLRHAYPGDDHAQLLASIANESPPRPRSLESRVPPDLEAIVLKATARDRKLRYATAEALAADLRAYLEGRPIAARPPSFAYHLRSAIRRHRALSATILVAFVALVASTAYYVTTLQSKEAATRFQSYVAIVAAGDAALDAHDVEAARRHLDAAPADHRGWEWQHVRSRFDRSLRTTDVGPGRVSDVAYHPAGDVFAAAAPNAVRIFDDS